MFHPEDDGIVFPDSRPVLLILDDGTLRVVTVKEWERQCGKIEDTIKVLDGYDNGDSPHATVVMIRAAVLGTSTHKERDR